MFVEGLGQTKTAPKEISAICVLPKWMYPEGSPCLRTEEWGMVTVPESPKEKKEREDKEEDKRKWGEWLMTPLTGLGGYMKIAFYVLLAAAAVGIYIRLR